MSPSDEPLISVVVATYNRCALLPRLFAGLAAQDLDGGFALIIVNDASTDDTRAVLDELVAAATFSARALHLDHNAGPATARNAGWRATSTPVVAFTDDDCVPSPRWLASLLESIAGADIVQGRTLPDPVQRESQGPFSRTLDVSSEDGYYQTCNIAYRRSVLAANDGFYEAFRFPAGEDTDLAWRAKEAGATTIFDNDAVVFHDVSPSSVGRAVRDSWRWQSVALAVKRHPGLRDRFWHRYIWRPPHLYVVGVLLGLIGLAIDPTQWAGWLAAAVLVPPYALYRGIAAPLPGVGPRRRWLLIPAAFAVDLAEVTACLYGSIRHRTFIF